MAVGPLNRCSRLEFKLNAIGDVLSNKKVFAVLRGDILECQFQVIKRIDVFTKEMRFNFFV